MYNPVFLYSRLVERRNGLVGAIQLGLKRSDSIDSKLHLSRSFSVREGGFSYVMDSKIHSAADSQASFSINQSQLVSSLLFCSTALTNTGWAQSTYSTLLHCPSCRLTLKHQEEREKSLKKYCTLQDLNLGQLGYGARTLPLLYAALLSPPQKKYLYLHVPSDSSVIPASAYLH